MQARSTPLKCALLRMTGVLWYEPGSRIVPGWDCEFQLGTAKVGNSQNSIWVGSGGLALCQDVDRADMDQVRATIDPTYEDRSC
jgi:hypothetical protein